MILNYLILYLLLILNMPSSLENVPQKGVAVSDFPEAKGVEIRQADDRRGAGAALLTFYRVWGCNRAFGLGIEDRKNSDFWVYMILLQSVSIAAVKLPHIADVRTDLASHYSLELGPCSFLLLLWGLIHRLSFEMLIMVLHL